MRILHLGKYYPPARGGIESHVRTLARAQTRLGAQVHVLVVNHQGPLGEDVVATAAGRSRTLEDRDGDVRVTRLGRLAGLRGVDLAPRLTTWIPDIARYDVVHLHTPNPLMLAAALAAPRIRSLVVTHHSDIVRQRILSTAHAPFEAAAYRRATRILACSPAYAESSPVLQRYRAKVKVVPLGIDLAPFATTTASVQEKARELRDRWGDGPVWLMVGRLVYYKGLEVAVQALGHVPGRLVVVGRGPSEDGARRMVTALGLERRVVWAGAVPDDDLPAYYAAATALWFPSTARSEAFGLSQVEAMAAGVPVLNTHIEGSGVPWVSLHDVSGLTVRVAAPDALAQASRRLLSEQGLRERLARGARERARAEFSEGLMAQRALDAYAEARAA
jgi:glycosyltransferase involved in cell wall biosynthesis